MLLSCACGSLYYFCESNTLGIPSSLCVRACVCVNSFLQIALPPVMPSDSDPLVFNGHVCCIGARSACASACARMKIWLHSWFCLCACCFMVLKIICDVQLVCVCICLDVGNRAQISRIPSVWLTACPPPLTALYGYKARAQRKKNARKEMERWCDGKKISSRLDTERGKKCISMVTRAGFMSSNYVYMQANNPNR